MLAGIISREGGDPWPAHGLSSRTWLDLPVAEFVINELIATQDGVYLAPLVNPVEPVGGDPLPHVVTHAGRHYIEDGHHRVVSALIRGEETILARWCQAG